jgi:ABC-type nickel/cobalt efflux system permease component RcnA
LRPLALALTTAVTHAASILLISLLVHGLLHTAFSIETISVFRWMNLLSGLILVGLGSYILYKLKKPVSNAIAKLAFAPATASDHGSGCSCPSHRLQPHITKAERTWKTVAIGFAVGLIPCPSALAALSTALASHDFSSTLLIISMFSLGIFLSLTLVGAFITKYSTKFLRLSTTKSLPHLASQIQVFVFVVTGFWHISMFYF